MNDVTVQISDLKAAIFAMESWLDVAESLDVDPDDIMRVERSIDAFTRIIRISAGIRGEKHLKLVEESDESEK